MNFDFAALNEIPPGLMNADLQKNHGNFGFGSFFYTDKYYIGASVPNVLKSTYFETLNGQYEDASEEVHFFVTGGYVFDLTKNIKFKPATFFKIVENSPISFDVTANFLFSERFGLTRAGQDRDPDRSLTAVPLALTRSMESPTA